MNLSKANEIGEITVQLNDDQYKRYLERRFELNHVEVFEYNGVFFKGDSSKAAALFVYNNPEPADFFVWLQDNYKTI